MNIFITYKLELLKVVKVVPFHLISNVPIGHSLHRPNCDVRKIHIYVMLCCVAVGPCFCVTRFAGDFLLFNLVDILHIV